MPQRYMCTLSSAEKGLTDSSAGVGLLSGGEWLPQAVPHYLLFLSLGARGRQHRSPLPIWSQMKTQAWLQVYFLFSSYVNSTAFLPVHSPSNQVHFQESYLRSLGHSGLPVGLGTPMVRDRQLS